MRFFFFLMIRKNIIESASGFTFVRLNFKDSRKAMGNFIVIKH